MLLKSLEAIIRMLTVASCLTDLTDTTRFGILNSNTRDWYYPQPKSSYPLQLKCLQRLSQPVKRKALLESSLIIKLSWRPLDRKAEMLIYLFKWCWPFSVNYNFTNKMKKMSYLNKHIEWVNDTCRKIIHSKVWHKLCIRCEIVAFVNDCFVKQYYWILF